VTNQLAECLAAKEMKKSQLAHRLHMSRAYVTRLVNGDIRPSLEAAIRIARFFRKPVEDIFQLEEAVPQIHFPEALPSAPGEQPKMAEKPKSK